MKITREIKTAILVVASILLFIWGYSFLKGRDLFNDYKLFYVNYDNVEGLGVSAPVTISGLVIGKVNSIKLNNNTGSLVVELQIHSDFPISKSSLVNIYEPGLIGGKQIQIVPNLADKTLAESGDTLRGGVVPGLTALVGEKLTPLQEKIEKLAVSADVLLNNFNTVLDTNTKNHLKAAIANLDATMAEFKSASGNLDDILAGNKQKLNSTFTNLDKTAGNLSKISDSIARADLGKTIRKLENTLASADQIMAEIQSGKGTMGKLMKDETLYKNFARASSELELLLQDVRLNPTRYVNVSLFGKKNKPYVAPKNDSIRTTD
ncbi:MAG TPA: MlaD family protein [Flavobacterium sp.]